MTDVHHARPSGVTPRYPVSTSSVSPVRRMARGRMVHERAVDRLVSSYRAIPPGETVRLAKRTSNLFRPRAEVSAPGLDVSGLDGVISINDREGWADVQGMCTYENLVGATLIHGFVPFVVPQLKTITLGGAVTGLGIESPAFRTGLPHESVLEMDVLTGDGEIVTATPKGEHADLFAGFPNSYGSLGYATRLRIELEPTQQLVTMRHVRFGDLDDLAEAIRVICAERSWDGETVDFLDGVVFSATESYLTLGSWADDAPSISDYTGRETFYTSIRDRGRDALTIHDYLWRWDTDWFWCSKAFGAQNPRLRRVWPARYRRSDVYHRIVGWENRYGLVAKVDGWRGKPARERVVQDVELPVETTAAFLRWFLGNVPMSPVWICPLRLRDSGGPLGEIAPGERPWSLYPLRAGQTYVNVGFWGTVPIAPGRRDGDVNRDVERAVADLSGHKSLYSDAFYGEEEFWAAYGGESYHRLKERYDPGGRLLSLYAKAVRAR
jgi:FAD/FMN-containing dehydrogenase